MTELLLLKILMNRHNYYKYAKFIKKHVLSDMGAVLFNDFSEYFHENKDVVDIDISKFQTWFCVIRHPVIKQDKLDLYNQILENLGNTDPEDVETDRLVKEFTKRDYFSQIADVSMQIAEGDYTKDENDVLKIIRDYEVAIDKASATSEYFVKADIIDIINNMGQQTGLRWRLPELNYAIGPIKHQLIIVGMRPNVGKSTFISSEASFAAEQLKGTDKKVVYLNNEEYGEEVKGRAAQSALGMTEEAMRANPIAARDRLLDLWGDTNKVVVYDKVKHITTANMLVEQSNPGFIVVDQLWKMQDEYRSADLLAKITNLYTQARDWGKEYQCPVICVHQLDGTAGGVLYPTLEQFYFSKTALQGDGDVIMTVGQSYDPSLPQNLRGVNIVKNKLGKHKDCIAAMKHGQFEVEILPDIGRFKGDLK